MPPRDLMLRLRSAVLGFFATLFVCVPVILAPVHVAYAAHTSITDDVLIHPFDLTVTPSPTLPPESITLEQQTVGALFDRDTTTAYSAFDSSNVDINLETEKEIHSIKIFGQAPNILTVQTDNQGVWETVTNIENINLATATAGVWNQYVFDTPVTTNKLRLLISPSTTSTAAVGLGEVEIWAHGFRFNTKDGKQLIEAMASADKPQNGRIYSATTNQGVIGPLTGMAPDDPADNSFIVNVARNPGDFVRAYIVYELYGFPEWITPLRGINTHAVQGGFVLPEYAEWTTQIEEINPEWLLRGDNSLHFAVPDGMQTSFTVRDLRIVGELPNGSNFVKRVVSNVIPEINNPNSVNDGDLNSGWQPYPPEVDSANTDPRFIGLRFTKPVHADRLSFYLVNTMTGQMDVEYFDHSDEKWHKHKVNAASVDVSTLLTGWNTIPIEVSKAVGGLRLKFTGGSQTAGEIRELYTIGSAVSPRYFKPEINIQYPTRGQFWGREAYLRGYVTPIDNGSGPAVLTIGSTTIPHTDGAFGIKISKDDHGYKEHMDHEPWLVTVKATYPDGQWTYIDVPFQIPGQALLQSTNDVLPTYAEMVKPGQYHKFRHDEAELEFDGDELAENYTITVSPLFGSHLPKLSEGMTNVTKGPRRGYRFLPHGSKFLNKVKVRLPYDRKLIPPGHTPKDIKTYYYDTEAGRWIALEQVVNSFYKTNKDEDDEERGDYLESHTDHFTDMINAIVTVPDHPEGDNFASTQIKDLEAANPAAKINLIEPPEANNRGDANLSYPIEVPPGRQGMQPGLSVAYSSANGNGWMGMGWDINPMPAITIDTRWGVPRYSTTHETETYLLNGQQLTPVAHRGELKPRDTSGQKIFHTRVEGAFQKIIRHGIDPTKYWWEVIDKDGTRTLYGGGPDVNGPTVNSTLVDATGNIFKWTPREIRDTNGNFVKYKCVRVSDTGNPKSTIPGSTLYLSEITYTGHGAVEGAYKVKFIRDRDLAEPRRQDVMIDARGGFKQVTSDLLRKVEVTFNNQMVRSYEFNYNQGAFHKTLLTSIKQYGEDGSFFNEHRLEYFDEVSNAAIAGLDGFTKSNPISQQITTVEGDSKAEGIKSTALGTEATSFKQKSKYGGISLKIFGFKIGKKKKTWITENGSTYNKIAYYDMDGDGRVDQVIKRGTQVFYRQNLSADDKTLDFGPEQEIASLAILSRPLGGRDYTRKTKARSGGFLGFTSSKDKSNTRTTGRVTISDVNGDQRPDVVTNSNVFFNWGLVNNKIDFRKDLSPTPIGDALEVRNPESDVDPEAKAEAESEFYLVDPVRKWVAPYTGTVGITGFVQLLSAPDEDYTTADGVRISIQKNGTELWTHTISDPTDTEAVELSGLGTISVAAGDRLYFRVNSRNDGAFDAVQFKPSIAYQGVDTTLVDENSVPVYLFNSESDFAINGRAVPFQSLAAGDANLKGDLIKTAATSDDVSIRVTRVSKLGKTTNTIQTIPWDQTGSFPINHALNGINAGMEVDEGEEIYVQIHSDSSIDLSKVEFKPVIEFTTVNGNPVQPVLDEDGTPSFQIRPPVMAQAYPRRVSNTAYTPWTVPAAAPYQMTVNANVDDSIAGFAELDSEVTLAIKGVNKLYAKQTFTIANGVITGGTSLLHNASLNPDDKIYLSVTASGKNIGQFISVTGLIGAQAHVVDLHLTESESEPFGGGYRNWYFGQYNGNNGEQPINEAVLRLPDLSDVPELAGKTIEEAQAYWNSLSEAQQEEIEARVAQVTKQFVMMLPDLDGGSHRWVMHDDECWISGSAMSASRYGINYIDFASDRGYTTKFGGVALYSEASSTSKSFGVGLDGWGLDIPFSASITKSNTIGYSWSSVNYLDFNGDSYPDVIDRGQLFATEPNGAWPTESIKLNNLLGNKVSQNVNHTKGLSIGGGINVCTDAEGNFTIICPTESISIGVNTNGAFGESFADWQLNDINGDGLVDLIRRPTKAELGDVAKNIPAKYDNDSIIVRLNYGYALSEEEEWSAGFRTLTNWAENNPDISAGFVAEGEIQPTEAIERKLIDYQRSLLFGGGGDVGFNIPVDGDEEFNFGVSIGVTSSFNYSKSSTETSLIDVNGDGLSDLVFKPVDRDLNATIAVDKRLQSATELMYVRFNTGQGFAEPVEYNHTLAHPIRSSLSGVRTKGGQFGINININFGIFGIGISGGVSRTKGNNIDFNQTSMMDINGDGYPDHVYSDREGNVEAAINNRGRTNLLKTVRRPLGATIAIDYAASGNTLDQPRHKWVMSRLEVNDGHVGDGVDTLLTTFKYESGRYDRTEREFYGYEAVITEERDFSNYGALYRSAVENYHTDSFYTRGLQKRSAIQDAQGNLYTESKQSYFLRSVDTGVELEDIYNTTATVFPELRRTDEFFYEGQPNAGLSTYKEYEYDVIGNVIRIFDASDSGPEDDVVAQMSYTSCPERYIMNIADSITVIGNNTIMRAREADVDCITGNVTQVRRVLANGDAANADIAYLPDGNMQSVTGAANHKAERFKVIYEYDPVVATHVTAVTDSFGYRSTRDYNFKYGTVNTITDLNNNVLSTTFDTVGRVTSITGPYQQGSGQLTISYAYQPYIDLTQPFTQSVATTQNNDRYRNTTDTIDTALFIDGLRRVLQTKKDSAIHTGEVTSEQEVMIVSGHVEYDFVGRSIKQYYPVTEPVGTRTVFYAAIDTVTPTTTVFDVLDRNIKLTIPDGTSVATNYDFAPGREGQTRFRTSTIDANNIRSEKFADVDGSIRSVKEINRNGTEIIWTSYRYDPLDQLTEVEDHHHNKTLASYDNFGRRTVIDSPDAGKTEVIYDLADNVIQRITANLRPVNKAINYDYEFNRLKSVTYPTYTRNNLSYEYGAVGATDNRVGRITRIHDAAGSLERFYGKLGEVVKETRRIAHHHHGHDEPHKHEDRHDHDDKYHVEDVYTTEYVYDTWNRIQQMTYPDGEVLSYKYNAGGQLSSIQGVQKTIIWPDDHDKPSLKRTETTDYLKRLEYDKFEDRAFMMTGNGVKTNYNYDNQTRRIKTLASIRPSGLPMQALQYEYGKVGNITKLTNAIPFVKSFPYDYGREYGEHDSHDSRSGHGDDHDGEHEVTQIGSTTQTFGYDDLYRLVSAQGEYLSRHHEYDEDGDGQSDSDYASDDEEHEQGIYKNQYTLNMAYDPIHNITQKIQHNQIVEPDNEIEEVEKNSYAWHYSFNGRRPHAPTQIGRRHFLYDNNGNQIAYYTGGEYDDDDEQEYGSYRKLVWDEENRLRAVFDGHHYEGEHDDDHKESEKNHYVYAHDDQRIIKHKEDEEVVYVNPYFVVKNHGIVTKNVMAGTTRVASKVRHQHDHYDDGGKHEYRESDRELRTHKPYYFYYHTNHLGSTQFITDKRGEMYQHLEDFPFGETWIDEGHRPSIDYRFTGKELDEETGLMYFGARYYDPRTSLWIGSDPALAKYFDSDVGLGGIYNPKNLGLYNYSGQNPILFIDPNGEAFWCFMGPWAAGACAIIGAFTVKEVDQATGGHVNKAVNNSFASIGDVLPDPGTIQSAGMATGPHGAIVGRGLGLGVIGLRSLRIAKSPVVASVAPTISKRLQYMGKTPDKFSRTGRDVVNRMKLEGKIKGTGDLTRGNPNNLQLLGTDGKWHRIDETIDMAHRTDAVSWWNNIGRFFGAKSKKVREFMLDSRNYRLEQRSKNRSEGGKVMERYLDPPKY